MPVLRIRVIPNASRSEIVGWMDDEVLKIKVSAPPEGGRANREVCDLLGKKLGLNRKNLRIVSGETSRNKLIEVKDVESSHLKFCLGATSDLHQ